jgi:hypothetical protein
MRGREVHARVRSMWPQGTLRFLQRPSYVYRVPFVPRAVPADDEVLLGKLFYAVQSVRTVKENCYGLLR